MYVYCKCCKGIQRTTITYCNALYGRLCVVLLSELWSNKMSTTRNREEKQRSMCSTFRFVVLIQSTIDAYSFFLLFHSRTRDGKKSLSKTNRTSIPIWTEHFFFRLFLWLLLLLLLYFNLKFIASSLTVLFSLYWTLWSVI